MLMQDENTDQVMSDSVKLGVLIHRMGSLEAGMSAIGQKLDNMGNLYPTMMTVDLLLAPLRSKISELEEGKKEAEREANRFTTQLKLALIMAVVGPILSVVILAVWGT